MSSATLKIMALALSSVGAGAIAISCASPAPASPAPGQMAPATAGAQRCSALVGRRLGGATIERVNFVASGTAINVLVPKTQTDICQVRARISAAAGSEIKIDVWLPTNWNRKMLGTGGGGFNGGLAGDAVALVLPANRGYVGLATDAGHDVSVTPTWALNHPEKIVDFASRANHLGALAAKAIIAMYYGTPAQHAYFHGCSNGGRDALMLAQRHPDDYDGIAAGAPANNWTALFAAFLRNDRVARLAPGVGSLGSKLSLVHDAAIKKCDALDGAKDGLISNPNRCGFDPAVLQCKAGSSAGCLSRPEVAAVRAIYRGTRAGDGRLIMPGFPPGSEYQWNLWFTSPKGLATTMGPDFYRYFVYSDPNWDPSQFTLDRDYPETKRRLHAVMDATDPDLRPFVRRGGKLLMYHGWDDAAIPIGNSILYYEAARRAVGAKADQLRFFTVPGMAHCAGGNGVTGLDPVAALDAWVEGGRAPERLTATKYEDPIRAIYAGTGKALATRPVCAWPKTPRYKGSGPVGEADSFVCR